LGEKEKMNAVSKPTITAAKRCEILAVAYDQATLQVGALLKEAEAPKAYLAYERLLRSLNATLRHAQRQRFKEESHVRR
jgi:hypothetical protein